jgi:hypothetical protein
VAKDSGLARRVKEPDAHPRTLAGIADWSRQSFQSFVQGFGRSPGYLLLVSAVLLTLVTLLPLRPPSSSMASRCSTQQGVNQISGCALYQVEPQNGTLLAPPASRKGGAGRKCEG